MEENANEKAWKTGLITMEAKKRVEKWKRINLQA